MSEDGEYRKLTKKEIAQEFRNLKGWQIVKGKLHREIKFRSFEEAISFMMRASLEIVKLDHHPEWLNVYNRVTIDLVTHDVGGLSNYDFLLASSLNRVLSRFRV